jgi:hypothetical protein
MTQLAEPIADSSIGSYTDQAGGTTNIYTTIDEGSASPNDADYIKSPLAPASSPYVAKVTSLSDPLSSSGHIIRARLAKDAAGGAQIDATVQLRQGYVSEGTPGTLIATLTQANVTDTFTTYSYTLSGAEADAITDYTSLYLRVVANQV